MQQLIEASEEEIHSGLNKENLRNQMKLMHKKMIKMRKMMQRKMRKMIKRKRNLNTMMHMRMKMLRMRKKLKMMQKMKKMMKMMKRNLKVILLELLLRIRYQSSPTHIYDFPAKVIVGSSIEL